MIQKDYISNKKKVNSETGKNVLPLQRIKKEVQNLRSIKNYVQ